MKKYPNGTGVYYVYFDPNTNETSATVYEVLNAIKGGALAVMVAVEKGVLTYTVMHTAKPAAAQVVFGDFTLTPNGFEIL